VIAVASPGAAAFRLRRLPRTGRLIGALRRVDARIRHALGVHVTVRGRIEGRTPGGMADTIRRHLSGRDELLDPRLEPAVDCARRAAGRASLRHAYEEPDGDTLSLAT
jgi:hypothetical protein